jgi:hypothetical protein
MMGLKGVRVGVEDMGDEVALVANKNEMQTRVELRLRHEGIRVYTQDEQSADPRSPYLYLNIIILLVPGTVTYAFTIDLEVHQILWVVSAGTPIQACSVRTWAATTGVYIRGSGIVRAGLSEKVDAMLDEFVNAWLETHPKR